jgi:RNA polymerase sigma factor (sigma-70 family)
MTDSKDERFPLVCAQRGSRCCPPWQCFNAAFLELLTPSNPAAVAFGAFIRRALLFMHLLGFYSELDVLSEVFIRAHHMIHTQGVEIRNPSAWAKKTALNVIREWSRNGKRFDSLDREVVDEFAEARQTRLSLESDVALLDRAWQSLTAEEQRLLTLKVFDKRSWQEIAAIYASEGKPIAEATLRQQKARALRHLRRIYHVLRPLTEV